MKEPHHNDLGKDFLSRYKDQENNFGVCSAKGLRKRSSDCFKKDIWKALSSICKIIDSPGK